MDFREFNKFKWDTYKLLAKNNCKDKVLVEYLKFSNLIELRNFFYAFFNDIEIKQNIIDSILSGTNRVYENQIIFDKKEYIIGNITDWQGAEMLVRFFNRHKTTIYKFNYKEGTLTFYLSKQEYKGFLRSKEEYQNYIDDETPIFIMKEK